MTDRRTAAVMTRSGVKVQTTAAETDAMARTFARHKCLILKGFIGPELLPQVLADVSRAPFYRKTDGKIAVELCMRQNALLNQLQFLSDDPALCAFIARIAGTGPLAGYDGRVYRFDPGAKHYDSWHDDIHERWKRRVAMSVNLSPVPYDGGALEIRHKRTKKMIAAVHNTVPGDAAIFLVDPALEHRVLPVTGGGSRVAFAGWFFEHTPNAGRQTASSNRVRSFFQTAGLL